MGLIGDCDFDFVVVFFKLVMWFIDDRVGWWFGDVGVDKMFLFVIEGEEFFFWGIVLGLFGMICNGGFEVFFGVLWRVLFGVDLVCLIWVEKLVRLEVRVVVI